MADGWQARGAAVSITATAGANGSITPSGVVNVSGADDQAFTITPDTDYIVEDVTVDAGSVGQLTSYTFTNVVNNHTIHATFRFRPEPPTVFIIIGTPEPPGP